MQSPDPGERWCAVPLTSLNALQDHRAIIACRTGLAERTHFTRPTEAVELVAKRS